MSDEPWDSVFRLVAAVTIAVAALGMVRLTALWRGDRRRRPAEIALSGVTAALASALLFSERMPVAAAVTAFAAVAAVHVLISRTIGSVSTGRNLPSPTAGDRVSGPVLVFHRGRLVPGADEVGLMEAEIRDYMRASGVPLDDIESVVWNGSHLELVLITYREGGN